MDTQFSKASVDFTKNKDKPFLKEHGIFFTPKSHRDKLLNYIHPFIRDGIRILEPSVGSGEFVKDLIRQYGDLSLHIDAIELNKELFTLVDNLEGCNAIHDDFISRKFDERYDIILGNPPYFEVNKKSKYFKRYEPWWKGRMNIYSLFILKSIAALKPGGILAFIVPPSWMNGKYYEQVRVELDRQGTMLHMNDLSQINTFMKTKQDTMLFVFQRDNNAPDAYKLEINNKIFYSFQKEKITKLMIDTTTIKQLGASVKTGPCVWNQMKDKLSDDSTKGIPLIYSNNIQDQQIVLHDGMTRGKKQYVVAKDSKIYQQASIVMNRGFGKGKEYKLTFAMCRLPKYTCENHTNVITAPNEEILQRIYKSLENPKTKEWCSLFIGNGQLSKTEIEEYMPIF